MQLEKVVCMLPFVTEILNYTLTTDKRIFLDEKNFFIYFSDIKGYKYFNLSKMAFQGYIFLISSYANNFS